jgi:hypothetical protein
MGIYNGVWEHLYRRYVKGERDDKENTQLITNENDAKPTDTYLSTEKNLRDE